MTRQISSTINGPLVLSLSDPLASGGSDDPLFISSTGMINSFADGIDGAASTPWIIFNQGLLQGLPWGIDLVGAGLLYNSGTIYGPGGGVKIGGDGLVENQGSIIGGNLGGIIIGGDGVVVNQGEINSVSGMGGVGVRIGGDGVVVNQGLIFGYSAGVTLGEGSITNRGSIVGNAGIILGNGGSVTNFGEITTLGDFGIDGEGGITSVTNMGIITGGTPGIGVALVEGSVTNFGTIWGGTGAFDVVVGGVGGTITNQGTISGGASASTVINQGVISEEVFGPSAGISVSANLLVIEPGAVFNGAAEGTTIELAHGSGAISGIGEGQFIGFDTLKVDPGANWTLNGPNTIGTVLNDGRLGVSGSLDVSTAVDPGSTGVFQLIGASALEVAAALEISSKIDFAAGSELTVDNFALFGEHVGAANYAGSLLENFSGSTVDLAGFKIAGLSMSFSASTGLLQLTNSASQAATLDFQRSTLGAGAFHFASDGNSGVLITHS